MAITPLPDPPTRSMAPADFIDAADATMAALPVMVDEINGELPGIATAATSAALALTASEALANKAAIDAGFVAASTSSIALTAGAKTANIGTGKALVTGDRIFVMRRGDAGIRAYANVTGYSSSTLSFTIASTGDIIGSGTFTDWIIGLAAFEPFQPPVSTKPIFPLLVEVTAEAYAVTTGVAKRTFHALRDYVLSEVIGELTVVQASGSALAVDVNVNGVSILSNGLNFDNTEPTTLTASVPAVFTGGLGYKLIAKGDKITIDVDQIGNGSAKGLKVGFILQEQ